MQRILQPTYEHDSDELRVVLKLPQGYRFRAVDVSCARIHVEYFRDGSPEQKSFDTLELPIAVRGEEAVLLRRRENDEDSVRLWVPRQTCPILGFDLATSRAECAVPAHA